MSDPALVSPSAYNESFTVSQAVVLAFAVVIVYDHFITFSNEVRLIWGRKLSSVTLLFYANRWAALVWALLQICVLFELLSPASFCVTQGIVSDTLVIILLAIWSLFSAIRTHAVSLGNWWLTGSVLILTMAPVAVMGCNLCITVSQMVHRPHPGPASGLCMWDEATNTQIGSAGFIDIEQLMLLPVYGYMEIVSVADRKPDLWTYSLMTLITSIFVTHFLLDLRQAARQPQVGDSLGPREHGEIRQSSSLRFASFIDNMGEELMYDMDDPSPGVVLAAATEQGHEITNGRDVQSGDILHSPHIASSPDCCSPPI
ncbi:hypothetical protein CERSUDRAFT_123397 [Gelatoporia subvermispora B]|uniref:DUF6533 domain-containing protein n=1 Tax=Ceriporiopsis subvermispora (strain B) TaxID=914234 RepID=M2PM45_CERS8|nr:hypothetical protein CERSUDRAFT_123397 [Gelatoporia subvermispora B]